MTPNRRIDDDSDFTGQRRTMDAWLYDHIEAVRSDFREAHKRLRGDLTDQLSRLERKFDEHAAQARRIETSLTVIQTERDMEERLHTRRGAWAGIVAAAGLTGLIETAKHFFGKP